MWNKKEKKCIYVLLKASWVAHPAEVLVLSAVMCLTVWIEYGERASGQCISDHSVAQGDRAPVAQQHLTSSIGCLWSACVSFVICAVTAQLNQWECWVKISGRELCISAIALAVVCPPELMEDFRTKGQAYNYDSQFHTREKIINFLQRPVV